MALPAERALDLSVVIDFDIAFCAGDIAVGPAAIDWAACIQRSLAATSGRASIAGKSISSTAWRSRGLHYASCRSTTVLHSRHAAASVVNGTDLQLTRIFEWGNVRRKNSNFIPDVIVEVPNSAIGELVVRSREQNDQKITIVNQKYLTLQRCPRALNR